MALEVHATDNSIIIHNGRNRIRITEQDLDDLCSIDVFPGPGNVDNLVYVLESAQEAGDIINGAKIRPKPGMVVKNESSQLVLHYLLGEIVDDKPVYQWHIPGVTYGLTSLSDDNYKILDVGEIDD